MASLPDLTKAGLAAAKKTPSHFQVALAKKNFQSLYGKDTLSSSIDKLTPAQLAFFRHSKYLAALATLFPKVKCSLNEMLKNLYLFGTSDQVRAAKSRVSHDLAAIVQHRLPLASKELADFLRKAHVKQKIIKFLEALLGKSSYGAHNRKSRDVGKSHVLVSYCTYEVGSQVTMDLSKNRYDETDGLPQGYTDL